MKTLITSIVTLLIAFSISISQPSLELVWKKNVFPTQIEFAKFSKDGNYIYCAIGNNIQVMDAKTGEFVSSFENQNVAAIYDLDISLNGNYIVTHDGGGSINIWDTRIKKAIKHISFVSQAGNDGALAVSISPDERFLIIYVMESITWNQFKGYIIKYDFISEKEIVKLQFDKDTRKIHISHDGKFFVTGSSLKNIDNTFNDQLILWDAVTMQQISVLEKINVGITYIGYKSIHFSIDDSFITIVKNNYRAQIIDIKNGDIKISSDSTRLCMNMELLPGNEDYLISYGTWEGDFDLEYYYLGTKKASFKYNCEILESEGNIDSWYIFAGTPKDYYYLFKKGITNIKDENDVIPLALYQNNNQLIIKSLNFCKDEIILKITDLSGKEYYYQKFQQPFLNNEFIVNIQLSSGIYICNIRFGSKLLSKKIEIVR